MDPVGAHIPANDLWIVVEDPVDLKAAVFEALIVGQGMAEETSADQDDRPLAIQMQDMAELIDQVLDVVTRTLPNSPKWDRSLRIWAELMPSRWPSSWDEVVTLSSAAICVKARR